MIVNANALHIPLKSGIIQTCVTSPPYFGLRDYGVTGQIGLEQTPQEYVDNLVAVFREVWRVMKDDGTLWLNLGDSYSNEGKNGGQSAGKNYTSVAGGYQTVRNAGLDYGLKAKQLLGIPWRAAFALQADGWYLRSDIIWNKPNCMTESVRDRPTKSHEYMFLLTKSARYYYDAEAIKEPKAESTLKDNRNGARRERDYPGAKSNGGTNLGGGEENRNKRTVWTIATMPYAGPHFAVFPPKLIEPCILAGSRPGDMVLDPFSGSGTTGRVAVMHGRRYVGVELNPAYIELTPARMTVQVSLL